MPSLVSEFDAQSLGEHGAGIAAVAASVVDSPALPERVLHLGMAFALAQVGSDDESTRHATMALDAGLTYEEAVEALAAAFLSRGWSLLAKVQWILDRCEPQAGVKGPDASPREEVRTERILDYFRATFSVIPTWLAILTDFAPQTLEPYFALRQLTFADQALPRRYKELLLVMVNATERYREGLRVHLEGAVQGGASAEELLCAVKAAIFTGGMVAWLEAADLLAPMLAAAAPSDDNGVAG